ncbi:MAG TPA: ABC transporter ATP-binding protein [Longilinea sp.]|nr:ABC transporter ATP-binding protein [Longilinea sp.]
MLEIKNIHKSYEGKPLLNVVNFTVQSAETVCLLGSSGSGKSTLLRIIAGLEQAEDGTVLWQGQDITNVPVHLRHFGLMFQDYALFPHRSVIENVAFGLRMAGLSHPEIHTRSLEALEMVNMSSFAGRRVTELSGGEQQRVALARSLAPRPRLLMLDEPLGALDRSLREELLEELRRLLKATGIPAIYVTHDQDEAFAIAGRLLLLHEGRIEQEGSPDAVYRQPVSLWAARFLGLTNLLPGVVRRMEPFVVDTPCGEFRPTGRSTSGLKVGDAITLLIQPASARLDTSQSEVNQISGTVQDCLFFGDGYRLHLNLPGDIRFTFHVNSQLPFNSKIFFTIPAKELIWLK